MSGCAPGFWRRIACATPREEFPCVSCLQIVRPMWIMSLSPVGQLIGPWPQPSPLALIKLRKDWSLASVSAAAGPATASDAAVATTIETNKFLTATP